MKKVILVGNVACGKTTLCQRLNGLERTYQKTQAVEVVNRTIDTPGEYLECRSCLQNLVVTSVEAEQVLFLLDASESRYLYSPGLAAAFPVPVAGVVTKIDLAGEAEVERAKELLKLAGAAPIFAVSAHTGEGIPALTAFLSAEE